MIARYASIEAIIVVEGGFPQVGVLALVPGAQVTYLR
jgi:hypothetical protein